MRFGLTVWTWLSTAPGVAMQAVPGDRRRVRPDDEVDAVADRRVAGAPDTRDPAVLDPDVRLDHADRRVDHDRADHDRVELRGTGRRPTGPCPAGCPWRSPRSARRRAPGDPPRPRSRGPCHRAGCGRPAGARSAPGAPPGRGDSRLRASSAVRRRCRRSGRAGPSRVSPGLQRSDDPASRSSRYPRAARRSNSSRALTRSKGKWDETRTTRREVFRTVSSRCSRPLP